MTRKGSNNSEDSESKKEQSCCLVNLRGLVRFFVEKMLG